MRKHYILFNLCALGLGTAVVGEAASKQVLAKGKTVFEQNCASCHGPQGEGDGPAAVALNPKPRNFKTEPFKNGAKPADIFKTVTEGLPGTLMVSFKHLPEADRKAVAEYAATLAGKEGGAKSDPKKK